VYGFKTGVTLPYNDSNHPDFINTYYGTFSNSGERDAAGDGMPWVLESLIRMYETTKDKAYLYEFMRQSLELQFLINLQYKTT